MPTLGVVGDGLTFTVDFDREDLSIFTMVADSEDFLAALAVVAVGVGTVGDTKHVRAKRKKTYQDAMTALDKARAVIERLSFLDRLALTNSIANLEGLKRVIASRLAECAPNGNPVDVGIRCELHAIAQVFRRFDRPVKLTGDPKPSAFITVACQLSSARGKRIAPDTMREHARAAGLPSAPIAGVSYPPESGAISGMMLGYGALLSGFGGQRMNMEGRVVKRDGGVRYEFVFTPASVVTIDSVMGGQPPKKSEGDKSLD